MPVFLASKLPAEAAKWHDRKQPRYPLQVSIDKLFGQTARTAVRQGRRVRWRLRCGPAPGRVLQMPAAGSLPCNLLRSATDTTGVPAVRLRVAGRMCLRRTVWFVSLVLNLGRHVESCDALRPQQPRGRYGTSLREHTAVPNLLPQALDQDRACQGI